MLTSDAATDYHRVIYDRLTGRVSDFGLDQLDQWEPHSLGGTLADVDIFHLHWPEWLLPPNIVLHQEFATALRRSGVTLIWSQHNLRAHRSSGAWDGIYGFWAGAADGVIHHSRWGMERALAVRRYRADCRHVVIRHPHFGPLFTQREARQEVERQLGWRTDVTRLSIIGSPRPGKEVDEAVAAFTRTRRPDLELRAFCLDGNRSVHDDPRVFAEPYSRIDRATYDRRLIASDALIMPFHGAHMLTTGTVADAIAHGLPCVTSDWRFLEEVLGEAAIPYGDEPAGLTTCLERLDTAQLQRAADAATALQAQCDPALTADAVFAFVKEVRAIAQSHFPPACREVIVPAQRLESGTMQPLLSTDAPAVQHSGDLYRPPISLVIFDADGVIVDTEPTVMRILTEHIQMLGVDISYDECEQNFVGLGQEATLRLIEGRYGVRVPADWDDELSAAIDAALSVGTKPVAGALDALARMPLPYCIASNGRIEKLHVTLGAIGLLDAVRDRLFTAADVGRPKPHPDIFLHAASKLGTPPTECLVIEDSKSGIAAARAANMRVFGYAPRPGLQSGIAADLVFNDMEKLPDLILAELARV